ncbi:MAG: YbbR-like domain-containing protein [Thermodesulfobacteriota bacterium]
MPGWLASLGRNKALKLLSLFLALALWLAVGGEERTETTLNISLELANLPQNLMVTSEVPSSVQVRVTGPRGFIRTLSQSRLTHSLDLAGVKAGRQSFPLAADSFDFPRGVQVTRVQPNPVVLTLTPTTTRSLPVQPVFMGHPPEGYEVKSVKTRPEKIEVRGPVSELEKLEFIPTVPLDITGLTSPITLATSPNFKELHLTLVQQRPILADVDIGPQTLQRTFKDVPVIPQPLTATLSPSKVSVTLQGPWPRVKGLEIQDLLATVDTEDLSPGRHRLKVQVQIPPGLTLEKISPKTIQARIKK